MRQEHLRDFIECYNPTNRHQRKETWQAENNPDGRFDKNRFPPERPCPCEEYYPPLIKFFSFFESTFKSKIIF